MGATDNGSRVWEQILFKEKFMNGNSKIKFDTFNVDGKKFSVSTTASELLEDWYDDCNMCPENDADIYNVMIDGKYHAELCTIHNTDKPITFESLMRKLECNLKLIASNIEWDLDDIEDAAEKAAINENVLPAEVKIPIYVAVKGDDAITEYLSNTYNYCVKGYTLTWEEAKKDIAKVSSLSIETMRKRLYEIYQLDWMQRHDCSIQDIIDGMADAQGCGIQTLDDVEEVNNVYDLYSIFQAGGFKGSIWVCYAEFMCIEYLEQDYIKELCDVVSDGNELYSVYLADIKHSEGNVMGTPTFKKMN
jgi:hypothetical protein